MANKGHKPKVVIQKLRLVSVLIGQEMQRVDAIREVSITEKTNYRCRKQYGGVGADQLKELKTASERERASSKGGLRPDPEQAYTDGSRLGNF